MRFESRSFFMSKDEGATCEDAFALDETTGRAAIADGVSGAIFSGAWARLLVAGAVQEPPSLANAEQLQAWLTNLRAEWRKPIDPKQLPWNVVDKLRTAGGQSTLMWLELTPDPQDGDEGYQLNCVALGDCCLFHLRGDRLLGSFPMAESKDFDLTPGVLVSLDWKRDHLLEFQTLRDRCLPGDLLVLCTDAVGMWILTRQENGEPVPLSDYWDLPYESWHEEILALRKAAQMRADDSTLVLLRVVAETAAPQPVCQGDLAPTEISPIEDTDSGQSVADDSATGEPDLVSEDEPAVGTSASEGSDTLVSSVAAADEPAAEEPETRPENNL